MTESPKTLRDEFAMAALAGLVVAGGFGLEPAEVAEDAYAIADAMMKARAQSLTQEAA